MSERCPRCQEGWMRSWDDLTEDEKAVVKRLPKSTDYSTEERVAMHRWCAQCWYESAQTETAA